MSRTNTAGASPVEANSLGSGDNLDRERDAFVYRPTGALVGAKESDPNVKDRKSISSMISIQYEVVTRPRRAGHWIYSRGRLVSNGRRTTW